MKKSLFTLLTFCILSFSACAQSSKTTGEKTMETAKNTTINVIVNGVTKTATLVNNVATKALLELLAKGNVTVKTTTADLKKWELSEQDFQLKIPRLIQFQAT